MALSLLWNQFKLWLKCKSDVYSHVRLCWSVLIYRTSVYELDYDIPPATHFWSDIFHFRAINCRSVTVFVVMFKFLGQAVSSPPHHYAPCERWRRLCAGHFDCVHFKKWARAKCRAAPRQIKREADQQVVLGRVAYDFVNPLTMKRKEHWDGRPFCILTL